MMCSATKAQGKDEEEGRLVFMVFVFPTNHYMCLGPAFQEVKSSE